MSGNAHRNRHRNRPCKNGNCVFCQYRPKVAKTLGFHNSTGNRHNPTAKKRGRREVK